MAGLYVMKGLWFAFHGHHVQAQTDPHHLSGITGVVRITVRPAQASRTELRARHEEADSVGKCRSLDELALRQEEDRVTPTEPRAGEHRSAGSPPREKARWM